MTVHAHLDLADYVARDLSRLCDSRINGLRMIQKKRSGLSL